MELEPEEELTVEDEREERAREMADRWYDQRVDREADDEPRRRRYISCSDGFCGANDCPRCRPGNFRGGVYIGDIEAAEEA